MAADASAAAPTCKGDGQQNASTTPAAKRGSQQNAITTPAAKRDSQQNASTTPAAKRGSQQNASTTPAAKRDSQQNASTTPPHKRDGQLGFAAPTYPDEYHGYTGQFLDPVLQSDLDSSACSDILYEGMMSTLVGNIDPYDAQPSYILPPTEHAAGQVAAGLSNSTQVLHGHT